MADMLNSTHSINLVRPKKLGSNSCPLPDDVLTDILSYVLAKTFFRLLSVCKTVRKLSSDSSFPPFAVIP
ncbi:hypothetical protein MUK42_33198 [Musa troglodytarum]|uniref:F-box domain-containing protein n=1 Tax=Musa troglodytarum TaxID=320322 RepID=A0A9E7FCJ3_9LILI|nr:hypothetical protein MUK42_33198 [Musa troglodytarum]